MINLAEDLRSDQGYNPVWRDPKDFIKPKQSLIDKLWIRFGIRVVEVVDSILIVDLSHWNGDVSFAMLKQSEVKGVILKCSEAAENTYYEYKDAKFETFWRAALDEGFPVMLYHFFRGEKGSAEKSWFMKCADAFLNDPRINGNTAVWLDCEWKHASQSRAAYTNRAFGFCSLIRGEGMKSGIYSSPGLVPTLFDPAYADWDDVFQWNAHWTYAPKDTLPAGWTESQRMVWQRGIYPTHWWVEKVLGAGTVDVNHGYWASEAALRSWLGQGGSSPSSSPSLSPSPSYSASPSLSPSASPSASPSPPDCCEEHELRIDTLEAGQQVLTEIQNVHGQEIANLVNRVDQHGNEINELRRTADVLTKEVLSLKDAILVTRQDVNKLLARDAEVKKAYTDE
jgi:GH25 family lysozyme M1 (1,4-beta-N-acetylmuramidase)